MSGAALAAVEASVRRVVAETLGVEDGELTPEVSLADDLAADSLDVVEMAMALERELGVALPDRMLSGVRTFGELVNAILALARRRSAEEERARRRPLLVVAGVTRPRARGAVRRGLVRTEWLTPYDAETIAEDALAAGRGARLDVVVPAGASVLEQIEVEERFARLRRRGLDVGVWRAGDGDPSRGRRRAGGRGATKGM